MSRILSAWAGTFANITLLTQIFPSRHGRRHGPLQGRISAHDPAAGCQGDALRDLGEILIAEFVLVRSVFRFHMTKLA
jgi:hypothetical protein